MGERMRVTFEFKYSGIIQNPGAFIYPDDKPFFGFDGRPIIRSNEHRHKNVANNGKWFNMWGRFVEQINDGKMGGFALVGEAMWAEAQAFALTPLGQVITYLRTPGSYIPQDISPFGAAVHSKLGTLDGMDIQRVGMITNMRYEFEMPSMKKGFPVVIGMGFSGSGSRSYRVALVVVPRKHFLDEAEFVQSCKYRIPDVAVPFPIQRKYHDDEDPQIHSVAEVDVQCLLEEKTEWTFGASFVPYKGFMFGRFETMMGEIGAASISNNPNPYTSAAKFIRTGYNDGWLTEAGGISENGDEGSGLTDKLAIRTADESGAEDGSKAMLQLAAFHLPQGIDALPKLPRDYEWALSVNGLVFVVNVKKGTLHGLDEVFDLKQMKQYSKATRKEQIKLLRELYAQQQNALKAMGFSYRAFAQEFEGEDE